MIVDRDTWIVLANATHARICARNPEDGALRELVRYEHPQSRWKGSAPLHVLQSSAAVPCDHGLLIVNIGDMLAEASGQYFPSTVHQVLNPVGGDRSKSRISLPLFLHPRRDVRLSERYTVGSYFDERLRELRALDAA
jgi:hypothetical protein